MRSNPPQEFLPMALLAIGFIFCSNAVGDQNGSDSASRTQYRQALAQLRSDRNIPQAKARFSRIIGLDPSFAAPHYNLAKIAERTGDYETAIRELEVFQNLSHNPVAKTKAQRDLMVLHAYASLVIPPAGADDNYKSTLNSSLDLLKSGRSDQALSKLRALNRSLDTSWQIDFLQAAAHFQQKNYILAVKFMGAALDSAPAAEQSAAIKSLYAPILQVAASKAWRAKSYKLASTYFEQAWHIRPNHPGLGLCAATAAALSKDRPRALHLIQEIEAGADEEARQKAEMLKQKIDKLHS